MSDRKQQKLETLQELLQQKETLETHLHTLKQEILKYLDLVPGTLAHYQEYKDMVRKILAEGVPTLN